MNWEISTKNQNLIILLIVVAISLIGVFLPAQNSNSKFLPNNPVFENYYSYQNESYIEEEFEDGFYEDEGEIAGSQTQQPPASQTENYQNTQNRQTVKVVKVVDGDTIVLENGQVVRYIGIDTPETSNPRKPVQCFGQQASNKNKELVLGKTVELERDISETDKYNRLLRYIFIGDLFVNDYLVRSGFAFSYPYPPDIAYQNQLDRAEQEAKDNNRGLWSSCASASYESTQKPNNPPTKQPTNDKDCTDFKTQKEAQLFFEANGGPNQDPHRLDVDKDGIACEGLN